MIVEGKRVTCVILLLVALVLLPAGVSAQDGEQGVRSATIDAELQPDGSLLVTERLQYDLGSIPRTGFVRRLTAPGTGSIEVTSVVRDGLEDDYVTTQADSTKRIDIGTEGVKITGTHDYKVTYMITNSLVHGDDTAQLRWAVVDSASIPADNITINFSSQLDITSLVCRVEPSGQGCPVEKASGNFTATLDELPSGKSLVLQATLPKDQLSYSPPSADDGENTRFWLLVFGLMVAGSCFGVYWWITAGDENQSQQPIPEHIDSLT